MTVLTQDFISVLLLCKNVSAGVVTTASDLGIILFPSTAAAALASSVVGERDITAPAVALVSSVVDGWGRIAPPVASAVVLASSVVGE